MPEGYLPAYVVFRYYNGSTEADAVFTVRADAQHFVDWHNAKRKGERKEIEEWEIVETALNPEAQ
jgi:hypothetical protein